MIKRLIPILLPLFVPVLLIAGAAVKDASAQGVNKIVNPSLETGIDNSADSWSSNSWGNLSANFSISSDSHSGNRAARVEVYGGTDGDAKWYFHKQNVVPGSQCTYSNWYKSNVVSDVTIEYTLTDNSNSYAWIGSPAISSSQYSEFSRTFTVPQNVQSMTVFHNIGSTGWLLTDTHNLTCQDQTVPSGAFNRGLVSIEFDDGWKNAYRNGFPIVEEKGFKATQYVITQTAGWQGYMSVADMQNLKNRGHDIGSHTVTHPHLPTLSNAEIEKELKDSKLFIDRNLNQDTRLFVTPYCESNAAVVNAAKLHYDMQRNCEPLPNTKQNFNAYNVRSYIVLKNTTNTQIRNWINEAKRDKTWIVLVYHEVKANPDNDWAISPSKLRSQLQIVKDSGITVKKTGDALAEVQSQL